MPHTIISRLALAFISLIFYSGPMLACSCISSTDEQRTARSDYVFQGTVIESKINPGLIVVYTFGDLEIIKGEYKMSVEVSASSIKSACGVSFNKNVRYRIYATEDNGRLSTGLCSSARALPFTWDELKDEAASRSNYLIANSPRVLIETKKLQHAGCQFKDHSVSINACFEGEKNDSYYCEGFFLSLFTSQDGSYDQNDINFRWHKDTDEIEITGFSALIYPDECTNGMNSNLRWERARALGAD